MPSTYGIGDLGNEAFEFVDYLKAAGQTIWQILPLNPVGFGYSPYQSPSAFAGNPMLISIDKLIEENLLAESDVQITKPFNADRVEFERVGLLKSTALKKAFKNFKARLANDEGLKADFEKFRAENSFWLEDYALFAALKIKYEDLEWNQWDEDIKNRDEKALKEVAATLTDEILYTEFEQYIFNLQWQKLHSYANERGIQIFGDIPIFVAADSADVWANQKFFQLDKDGRAEKVAGVPPDYFSPTGQLWGNPLYDWEAMEKDNYGWWKLRFKQIYKLVDIARIDHFRGFEAYWSVDGDAENAINGHWVKGPGKPFFDIVKKDIGDAQIVAEDLGFITDDVEQLRQDCGFPGMKILQFELVFNEDGRIGFLAPENSITYTGTHDNNTVVGWYMEDVDNLSRATIAALLGADVRRPDDVCQKLIEFAYASDSRFTIVPMQDVLKLDSKSRMNTPGTVGTNWGWRLKPDYKLDSDAGKLKALCQKYLR